MITFKDLRNLVGTTAGKALPTARALRESGIPIIVQAMARDGKLTVYENGFYTYSTPSGTTVYAVDRCHSNAHNSGDLLTEDILEGADWTVRLLLESEDRLEDNNNAREGNHFSYSADTTERDDMRDPYNFVEDLENRDLVERMMARLTEKQRQIVLMYFIEKKNQQEIAEILSIRKQVVSRHVQAAIKKMRI